MTVSIHNFSPVSEDVPSLHDSAAKEGEVCERETLLQSVRVRNNDKAIAPMIKNINFRIFIRMNLFRDLLFHL